MATFTHKLQGTTDTVLGATMNLQFAGEDFDSKIEVNEYNDGTFVKDGTTNESAGNTPTNVKYIDANTAKVLAQSNKAVDTVTEDECTMKIEISHASAIAIEDGKLYAYDGSNTANAPDGMNFKAFEQGDSSWSTPEGSASALTLDDKTSPATTQSFFIGMSAGPDSVGVKTGKYRLEVTYY